LVNSKKLTSILVLYGLILSMTAIAQPLTLESNNFNSSNLIKLGLEANGKNTDIGLSGTSSNKKLEEALVSTGDQALFDVDFFVADRSHIVADAQDEKTQITTASDYIEQQITLKPGNRSLSLGNILAVSYKTHTSDKKILYAVRNNRTLSRVSFIALIGERAQVRYKKWRKKTLLWIPVFTGMRNNGDIHSINVHLQFPPTSSDPTLNLLIPNSIGSGTGQA